MKVICYDISSSSEIAFCTILFEDFTDYTPYRIVSVPFGIKDNNSAESIIKQDIESGKIIYYLDKIFKCVDKGFQSIKESLDIYCIIIKNYEHLNNDE